MLIWYCNGNYGVTISDLTEGAIAFYKKYNIKPDKIYVKLDDIQNFLPMQIIQLEAGKQYGTYVQTSAGVCELLPLESSPYPIDGGSSQTNMNINGTKMSVIVFDNLLVDKEFEKHVLNG